MKLYTIEHKMFDPDIPEAGGIMCAVNLSGDFIGDEDTAKFICDERGISPELRESHQSTCSIGFCEAESKWYGWSHRAICGFGVGSKVSKGDCGYMADTPQGLIDAHADFFGDLSDDHRAKAISECSILPDGSGIRILHAPLLIPTVRSAHEISEALDETSDLPLIDLYGGERAYEIVKCGRGEWTAKTLEDARQMACDFAESVS